MRRENDALGCKVHQYLQFSHKAVGVAAGEDERRFNLEDVVTASAVGCQQHVARLHALLQAGRVNCNVQAPAAAPQRPSTNIGHARDQQTGVMSRGAQQSCLTACRDVHHKVPCSSPRFYITAIERTRSQQASLGAGDSAAVSDTHSTPSMRPSPRTSPRYGRPSCSHRSVLGSRSEKTNIFDRQSDRGSESLMS